MAGPTFKARLGKKRRGKAGNLTQSQQVLWRAITEAEDVLNDAESNQQTLAACHAIAQACTAYSRLLQAGEIEARLTQLERQLAAVEVQHAS